MMRAFYAILMCLIGLALAACDSLNVGQKFGTRGANPLPQNEEAVRKANLIRWLYPPEDLGTALADCTSFGPIKGEDLARACLEDAAQKFEQHTPSDQKATQRNLIVGRLVFASNEECTAYEQKLNALQANVNLGIGTIATGTGAAGAVVTGAAAARTLSGITAFLTGARAEYNADIFFRQAVPSLVKAINTSRAEYLTTVNAKRELAYEKYTIWDALGDVSTYHSKCSLVEGIVAINQAVALADSPGLDAVGRTLVKTNIIRSIAQDNITDPRLLSLDEVGSSVPAIYGQYDQVSVDNDVSKVLVQTMESLNQQFDKMTTTLGKFDPENKAVNAVSTLKNAVLGQEGDAKNPGDLPPCKEHVDRFLVAREAEMMERARTTDDTALKRHDLRLAYLRQKEKAVIGSIKEYRSFVSRELSAAQRIYDEYSADKKKNKTIDPKSSAKKIADTLATPNQAPVCEILTQAVAASVSVSSPRG